MSKEPTFEQRCLSINTRYERRSLTERQKRKFYNLTFEAGPITRMYRRRKVFYCSECGSEVQWLGQKECPVCHAKWKAQVTEDVQACERRYHMALEAKGDIQVSRILCVERRTWFCKEASVCVWEVERIMYAPTGERKVFSIGVQCLSIYYDAFVRFGDLKLRRENGRRSGRAELRYNLDVYSYSIKSLTQQWQYKRIPELMEAYKNDTSVLRVIAYPWAETMLKTGKKKLFDYLVYHYRKMPYDTAHALNICTRNHYEISDPSMWLDTIHYLRFLGMDTHNPVYVCPKDLRGLHQTLMKRYDRENDRRSALREAKLKERLRKIRMEHDKAYADMMNHWPERMGKILSLHLTADNLSVKPLQSIEEFKEEGSAMHHCVFSMSYYDYNEHPASLILSAKDANGKRLATIEYNTEKFMIMQCRAADNAVPERDAEIRKLITDHKNDFAKLLKKAA